MRISSYITPDGRASYGIVKDGKLHDAGRALGATYPDLRAVIAAGALDALKDAAGDVHDMSDVTLLSPVPNPDKIICIGLNYMTHIKETGRDVPKHPPVFTRYPSSVIGHDVPLIRPPVSDWFDFEGELAVIIGTGGRNIPEDQAMSHVAGYSCFNDGSIRDYQRHTSQFWPGKNFDDSGSMGPWMVTADDLPDPEAQSLETRLNGEVMQSTPISDLAFNIPQLIAYLSIVTKLLPGDVIATGTPGGVGLFRDPKLFMKAGDRVDVEITGVGTLSNIVEDAA
ncbi:MAG: 5-oxopent-3-ene-1,2,5-tricarboxylate decarboxylase [Rhodobacteraceae bacterium]|nr:5-oxopent-3-ene-1,2,5-tricarboxylate decarboxylase [Paracoccaceae bacterium]MAY47419.1 5-oxopent-3-ene-1,2,5-tricarboxylate decarboxylase [Paracoccaceae bacterium]QEW19544.1 Ureidoglycolate lyase [Marinibacterium anthonyi]